MQRPVRLGVIDYLNVAPVYDCAAARYVAPA